MAVRVSALIYFISVDYEFQNREKRDDDNTEQTMRISVSEKYVPKSRHLQVMLYEKKNRQKELQALSNENKKPDPVLPGDENRYYYYVPTFQV